MKPDNIYRTLVNIVPDLYSEQVWEIHSYIMDLIDDERKRLIELGWTPPNDTQDSIPKAYVMYEDERYPQLILTGNFGTRGYWIDPDTGELNRF